MNFIELCDRADNYIHKQTSSFRNNDVFEQVEKYRETIRIIYPSEIADYSIGLITAFVHLFSCVPFSYVINKFEEYGKNDDYLKDIQSKGIYNCIDGSITTTEELSNGLLENLFYFSNLQLPDFVTETDRELLMNLSEYYNGDRLTLYDIFSASIKNGKLDFTDFENRKSAMSMPLSLSSEYILCDKYIFDALNLVYTEQISYFFDFQDFAIITAIQNNYVDVHKLLDRLQGRKCLIRVNTQDGNTYIGTQEDIDTFVDLVNKRQIMRVSTPDFNVYSIFKKNELLVVDKEALEEAELNETLVNALESGLDENERETILQEEFTIYEYIRESFKLSDESFSTIDGKIYYLTNREHETLGTTKIIKKEMKVDELDVYVSGYFIGEDRLLLLCNRGIYELLPETGKISLLFNFRVLPYEKGEERCTITNPLKVEYDMLGVPTNLTDITTLDNGSSIEKGVWFFPVLVEEKYDIQWRTMRENGLLKIQEDTIKLMKNPTYDRERWLNYCANNLMSLDELCLAGDTLPICITKDLIKSRRDKLSLSLNKKRYTRLMNRCIC